MAAVLSDNQVTQALNTLRGRDVGTVLAELEAIAPLCGTDKRQHVRHRYASDAKTVVTIIHPGGSTVCYAVVARNLSETGIGFLHGSFLHHGTRCIISLETAEGKRIFVPGTVRRCTYLRNSIHEIGVRLERPIDLYQLGLAPATPTSAPAPAQPTLSQAGP